MQHTDNTYCRNGDIFMADLPDDMEGSLQSGSRPVLVISNNLANHHSPIITIIPLTSRTNKRPLPTHVVINGHKCGLKKTVCRISGTNHVDQQKTAKEKNRKHFRNSI